MYGVSQTFTTLIANPSHRFETSIAFGNTAAANGYKNDSIFSVEVSYRLFNEEQPSVGGCLSAELKVRMLKPSVEIPRMSKVIPYVRVTDGVTYSEWIPQGVFWIDTREVTHNDDGLDVLSFTAFDAMLKTEDAYPSVNHGFPISDISTVEEIAATIGVGVDPRTYSAVSAAYSISAPLGYSMREVLGNIAAMYAGNWIMNYDGQLRLVCLTELPQETNYLIDQAYDVITFGGDRVLV